MQRFVALLLLAAFLGTCTRQVPRASLETRQYQIDWASLAPQRIERGGIQVEGVLLTPAQWPLESSVKRLLQGDFLGVFTGFDLTFHSSRVRGDALQKLLDEGYLSAFMRVRNATATPRSFEPQGIVVRVQEDAVFYPVPSGELPARFTEIDWARTGATVVVAALLVALVVLSARKSRGSSGSRGFVRLGSQIGVDTAAFSGADTEPAAPNARGSGTGLLKAGLLQPGAQKEGFLFFRIDQMLVDWSRVRLEFL